MRDTFKEWVQHEKHTIFTHALRVGILAAVTVYTIAVIAWGPTMKKGLHR